MKRILLALALGLASLAAQAGEITVSKPWVRGTLADARSSTAFMEFLSDEAGEITGASSPLAQSVVLQDMRFALDGGTLKPTPVDSIPFEKRRKLLLTPVTAHFVLQGLSKPVNAGDRIPLILQVKLASGETREVKVEAVGRSLMR